VVCIDEARGQKQDPVHTTLQGCTFLFNYCKKKQVLQARAQFKNPDDASILAQALANPGIQARIHAWQGCYYVLKLTGQKHSETGRKQPRMAKSTQTASTKTQHTAKRTNATQAT